MMAARTPGQNYTDSLKRLRTLANQYDQLVGPAGLTNTRVNKRAPPFDRVKAFENNQTQLESIAARRAKIENDIDFQLSVQENIDILDLIRRNPNHVHYQIADEILRFSKEDTTVHSLLVKRLETSSAVDEDAKRKDIAKLSTNFTKLQAQHQRQGENFQSELNKHNETIRDLNRKVGSLQTVKESLEQQLEQARSKYSDQQNDASNVLTRLDEIVKENESLKEQLAKIPNAEESEKFREENTRLRTEIQKLKAGSATKQPHTVTRITKQQSSTPDQAGERSTKPTTLIEWFAAERGKGGLLFDVANPPERIQEFLATIYPLFKVHTPLQEQELWNERDMQGQLLKLREMLFREVPVNRLVAKAAVSEIEAQLSAWMLKVIETKKYLESDDSQGNRWHNIAQRFQTERDDFSAELATLRNKHAELESDLVSDREKLEELEQLKTDAEQKVESLSTKLATKETQLDSIQDQLRNANERLAAQAADTTAIDLATQLSAEREKCRSLEGIRDDLKHTINVHQKGINEKDAQLAELNNKVQNANVERAVATQAKGAVENSLYEAKVRAEEQSRKLTKTESDLTETQNMLTAALQKVHDQVVAAVNKEKAEFKDVEAKWHSNLDKEVKKTEAWMHEVEKIRDEKSAEISKASNLQLDIVNLERDKELMKVEINRHKDTIGATNVDLEKVRRDFEHRNIELQDLQTQIADKDKTGRHDNTMVSKLSTEVNSTKADLAKAQKAVKVQERTNKDLRILFGHAIGYSDFDLSIERVVSSFDENWTFSGFDIRLAVEKWRDGNEYTPKVQPAGLSPDTLAFEIWILSVMRPHVLSHEVIAIWMHSAEKYFNKSSTLGFLMTALENICANELNPDQTWFAVRLLEFFLILDKDKKLQLDELLLLICENGSKQHPVPMALCLWMQDLLDGKSSTRGQALGVWLKDTSRCIDLGNGVYTFQAEGCSDVIVTDPMNKILKRDLKDVVQYINKSLDLVLSVRDYDRQAIMNLSEHTRIVAAFPDLK